MSLRYTVCKVYVFFWTTSLNVHLKALLVAFQQNMPCHQHGAHSNGKIRLGTVSPCFEDLYSTLVKASSEWCFQHILPTQLAEQSSKTLAPTWVNASFPSSHWRGVKPSHLHLHQSLLHIVPLVHQTCAFEALPFKKVGPSTEYVFNFTKVLSYFNEMVLLLLKLNISVETAR